MRATIAASFACLLAAVTSCDGPELEPVGPLTASTSPAGPGSGQPFLSTAADGSVLLSWLEAVESGHALRYARLRGDVWSVPGTITESTSFFVNWADFPSILELADGRLAAHWLARSGPDTYAYDVMISVSDVPATRWSEPVRPHRDGTQTEHGFVSLFEHEGRLAAVWLDGRRFAGPDVIGSDADSHTATREMTVRYTTLGADGPGAELRIDARACDCCQTDVALTGDGPVVVYRDRSDAEIRDIVASRFVGGRWSEPATRPRRRLGDRGLPGQRARDRRARAGRRRRLVYRSARHGARPRRLLR